jgi:AcrR family transcriptional regulator
MARPVDADSEATKARVLESARVLFSERGAGDTSMRDIAKGAGVSLATVHHYFGSKGELFQRCVDEMYLELSTLRGELETLVQHATDPVSAFLSVIPATYAFVRQHRREVQLLMRTIIGTGRLEVKRRDEFLLPILEQGSQFLSSVTGVDIVRARMTVLSLNHLVIRYALTSGEDLVLVTGVSAEGALDEREARAIERVEHHLRDLALAMLIPS